MTKIVRVPNVSGTFYTSNPETLREQLERFLSLASVPSDALPARAFIAPHAGYTYSGQVAAQVYRILEQQQPGTVIIIGPSHYTFFHGISIDPSTHYLTPFGEAVIDMKLASRLREQSPFLSLSDAHRQEHSLEMQIPFIQLVSPSSSVLPLLVGQVSAEEIGQAADALAAVARDLPDVVIIASSDFSHFHTYATAQQMDTDAINLILDYNLHQLTEKRVASSIEMCGFVPAVITMLAMRKIGINHATLLQYANSGDVTGDHQSVVGYGAIALHNRKTDPGGIDQSVQDYLLNLARMTIRKKLGLRHEPLSGVNNPILTRNMGAFVTLHKHGDLRGCIGYVQAFKPLATTIEEMAEAAAFKDPRFPPLNASEEPDIDIEISVLSELEPVTDVRNIEVGRHGLVVRMGPYSGLLLPQVAVEWGWNREQFLQQTCLKAGLPPDSWKQGAQLLCFTATVFGETLASG